MINLCMCLCLQQFDWGVEAAELRDVRADQAEYAGEWSIKAGGGGSSQEARDSGPHVATGALMHAKHFTVHTHIYWSFSWQWLGVWTNSTTSLRQKKNVWDHFQSRFLNFVDYAAKCHVFMCCLHFITIFGLSVSLQYSSQSDPTSANQQVQLLLGEKQQLEAHNHQVCIQGTVSYSCLWHICVI